MKANKPRVAGSWAINMINGNQCIANRQLISNCSRDDSSLRPKAPKRMGFKTVCICFSHLLHTGALIVFLNPYLFDLKNGYG